MKSPVKLVIYALMAAAFASSAMAASASTLADVAKAQVIIGKIQKVVDKYNKMTIELTPPTPIEGSSGKFYSPFTAEGTLTEWADKALNAAAGAAVGEQAGAAVGKALASKVPFGGLMAGKSKKAGKKMGAMAAIGGKEFIEETTVHSFNTVDDLIVYLHAVHSGNPEYQEAMASVMAIHPEMEHRVDYAITQAYRNAAKEQAKAKKKEKKKK